LLINLAADHLAGLILEIDIGELLPTVVTHDKSSGLFFDGPWPLSTGSSAHSQTKASFRDRHHIHRTRIKTQIDPIRKKTASAPCVPTYPDGAR
jgi:hypothetical protein